MSLSKAKDPVTCSKVDSSKTIVIDNNSLVPRFHQLIRVPVFFNQFEAQALVDTGASTSILSAKLLKRIPFEIINRIQLSNLPIFKSVPGDLINPKGQII